ncbi:amidohydrolase [Tenggerimyces flavus]|uniref:Amidohydrolase family protein n=1 Tax=Tenggerimyces flavus TaxID=1708749 RepID=A0ABV7YFK5_9ACTN|nr:amidohydrolase family protein [Tenggerimyces flavus]MBM7786038.1 putative amidohydrolase YtcJ [Tenggerimyces flavus]
MLVLRQARLGSRGQTADLTIDHGLVTAITPAKSTDVPRDATTVDLEGRTVLPAMWDAHAHLVQWATSRRRIDLTKARSAADAVALVLAAVDGRAGGEIISGFGFRDGIWPDQPHQDLLQAALPDRPIALLSNDLHTVWLSPAALEVVGANEHETGILREQDCLRAVAALPQAPVETLDQWVAEAATAAAARGVAGIIDFEFADNLTDWPRRLAQHRIDVRIQATVYPAWLEHAIAAGHRTGDRLHDLLEVGPLKLFVDGSLNTRTAYCARPYPGLEGDAANGLLELPPDELVTSMRRAVENGLQPAVHAIGDLANRIALDAFEQVGCTGRIEHAQLVDVSDVHRFARPGLAVGVQPAHAPDDRDVADKYWAGRTERAFPYADLLRAGATLELGSDAPVAPLDPWDGIASAITRTDDDRPAWHPEQALELPDALAAASRGRRELEIGQPADVMILDDDPADLVPEDLRKIEVFGTLLAGRWTHGNPTG